MSKNIDDLALYGCNKLLQRKGAKRSEAERISKIAEDFEIPERMAKELYESSPKSLKDYKNLDLYHLSIMFPRMRVRLFECSEWIPILGESTDPIDIMLGNGGLDLVLHRDERGRDRERKFSGASSIRSCYSKDMSKRGAVSPAITAAIAGWPDLLIDPGLKMDDFESVLEKSGIRGIATAKARTLQNNLFGITETAAPQQQQNVQQCRRALGDILIELLDRLCEDDRELADKLIDHLMEKL